MDIVWEVVPLLFYEPHYPKEYTGDEELVTLRGLCNPKNGKAKYVACWCIESKVEEAKKNGIRQLIMSYDIDNGFHNCTQPVV